jgi:ribosomal protein L16/L10AE
MADWILTEGLGLISVLIVVLENNDIRERQAETTRQSVMRILASYEEILKEK